MPSRNSVKQYLENSFYHLYNRGIDKRIIFNDELDYGMFLSYLKYLLVPSLNKKVRPVRKTNFFGELQLNAYCLMPNHFHLLVKQVHERTITRFMRTLSNSYTKYFNTRYKRVGPLFQGKYKGILIKDDTYLLHLSRYLHHNPLELGYNRSDLFSYRYSSCSDYLGKRRTSWIDTQPILAFFRTAQSIGVGDLLSYESFLEDDKINSEEVLGELTLEMVSTNRSDL